MEGSLVSLGMPCIRHLLTLFSILVEQNPELRQGRWTASKDFHCTRNARDLYLLMSLSIWWSRYPDSIKEKDYPRMVSLCTLSAMTLRDYSLQRDPLTVIQYLVEQYPDSLKEKNYV